MLRKIIHIPILIIFGIFLLIIIIDICKGDTRPVVVLDPGHGTKKSAVGAYGEAKINLTLAKRIEYILKANNINVYLTHRNLGDNLGAKTRVGDSKRRAQFANSHQANLFLRLHCDSFNGISAIYYPRKKKQIAAQSRMAAVLLKKEYYKIKIPGRRTGLRDEDDLPRGLLNKKMMISSYYANVPSVMIEMIALNKRGRSWIRKTQNQKRIAITLSKAIVKSVAPGQTFINPYIGY